MADLSPPISFPKTPTLIIRALVTPPTVANPITLIAAYINEGGSLIDITYSDNISYTQLFPDPTLNANVVQQLVDNPNIFIANQITSLVVQVTYNPFGDFGNGFLQLESASGTGFFQLEDASGGGFIELEGSLVEYTTTYNIEVVLPLIPYSLMDYYNLLKQEEPQNVYTDVQDSDSFTYLDNNTVAKLISESEISVYNSYFNVYPERANDLLDYYFEFFNFDIITPVYANELLQLINNLSLITNASRFTVSSNIASFIYFLTGVSVPVFINDNTFNILDYWILGLVGHSELSTTTYLLDSKIITTEGEIYILNGGLITFNELQTNLINNFINNLIRPTKVYEIFYNQTLDDVGLFTDLGATYEGDIRLLTEFAIAYDTTTFTNFHAYADAFNPKSAISLIITPDINSTLNLNQYYSFNVIAVFSDTVQLDVTLQAKIIKDNYSTNPAIITWHTIKGVNIGTTNFMVKYGNLTYNVVYNIA